MEVSTPTTSLRPEMFCGGHLNDGRSVLTVSRQAIQQAGNRLVAFVASWARFAESRDVTIGEASKEYAKCCKQASVAGDQGGNGRPVMYAEV